MLPSDSIQILRQEFRTHLEKFYADLNLAPPYHSIEKAVQYLSNTLRTKSEPVQDTLLSDPEKKWVLFKEIFHASGLSRKHRGIIIQLAQTPLFSALSEESLCFISVCTDTPLSSHS